MLTIELEEGTVEWGLGNPVPESFIFETDVYWGMFDAEVTIPAASLPYKVISVTASDNELYAIRCQLEGLSHSSKCTSTKWFGDQAKFIVANFMLNHLK